MNFEQAINQLSKGKKVRRPSWEDGSYWILLREEMICWKNGTSAHVHLNQINANDWEIYKEKPKVIILDDNELSILSYAEEFPEKWKKICDALKKKERKK